MSKKHTLLTFKGICMNFLLELIFFILSHPVTSKQPHKIVHMRHPVGFAQINHSQFSEVVGLPFFTLNYKGELH